MRGLAGEQDKESWGSESQGALCQPLTLPTRMDLGGEVSTTLTLEPVKPACLLPLAGLLMKEWPGQWESHVPRPKSQETSGL